MFLTISVKKVRTHAHMVELLGYICCIYYEAAFLPHFKVNYSKYFRLMIQWCQTCVSIQISWWILNIYPWLYILFKTKIYFNLYTVISRTISNTEMRNVYKPSIKMNYVLLTELQIYNVLLSDSCPLQEFVRILYLSGLLKASLSEILSRR